MALILASSSVFRKKILEKTGIAFSSADPAVDETPLPGETPAALVERLALLKAEAVAAKRKDYVIGSDQVATIDGKIIGKPHTAKNAMAQLRRFSGRRVDFLTGLCLRHDDMQKTHVEPFRVHFRRLSEQEIRTYVDRERPLQSAGSFQCEGLGILLLERLEGRDPNALIGLPLIALNTLFAAYGVNLLDDAETLFASVLQSRHSPVVQ